MPLHAFFAILQPSRALTIDHRFYQYEVDDFHSSDYDESCDTRDGNAFYSLDDIIMIFINMMNNL